MTATPRSDAVLIAAVDPVVRAYEMRLLAEQLERELANWIDHCACDNPCNDPEPWKTTRREISRLQKENAELKIQSALYTARFREMQEAGERLRAENESLRRAYVRPDDLRVQLEEAQARNARLKAALPPSHRLRTLADWFDMHDALTGLPLAHTEVQRDLRKWADAIDGALK